MKVISKTMKLRQELINLDKKMQQFDAFTKELRILINDLLWDTIIGKNKKEETRNKQEWKGFIESEIT